MGRPGSSCVVSEKSAFVKCTKQKYTALHQSSEFNFAQIIPGRNFAAGLDKKLTFKSICDDFKLWKPWQQRIMICGLTERSSETLLRTLSTVVEPLFHRDYEVYMRGDYPSSLIRHFIDSVSMEGNEAFKLQNMCNLMQASSLPGTTETDVTTDNCSMACEAGFNCTHPSLLPGKFLNDDAVTSCCNTKRLSVLSAYSVHRSGTVKNRTIEECPTYEDASQCDKISEPLQPIRVSESNQKHQLFAKDNSNENRIICHLHAKASISSAKTSLPGSNYLNGNASAESVKSFKNRSKPLTSRPHQNGKLQHPPLPIYTHSIKLDMRAFKELVRNVFLMFSRLSNAEKGDFYLELLNDCSEDQVIFFGECVIYRLVELRSILKLTDSCMLKIFKYLDADEIITVSHVCKRWHVLSRHPCLWKQQCFNLASQFGYANSFRKIFGYSDSFEWRHIYRELKEAISVLKVSNEDAKEATSERDGTVTPQKSKISRCATISKSTYSDILHYLLNVRSPELEVSKFSCNSSVNAATEFDGAFPIVADVLENVSQTGHYDISIGTNLSMLQLQSVPESKPIQVSTVTLVSNDHDQATDIRHDLIQAGNLLKRMSGTQKSLEGQRFVLDKLNSEDFASVPIYGVKTIKRVRKLQGHSEPVLCLQFDARRVMSGSADRTVRLYDVRSGRDFHVLKGHKGGVRCLHFDASYIVTGSWDTAVMIWDVATFVHRHTIAHHKDCVSCLEMTESYLITASHDCSICVWKMHDWKHVVTMSGHTAAVTCMSVIQSDQILTGSVDRTVKLWELRAFTLVRSFDIHSSPILTVKLCGNLVATGTVEGIVNFWDLTSGRLEGAIQAHEGPVYTLCFVGDKFITGGGDNAIKEWDLGTCTCLRTLAGHTGPVLCVRASKKRIVSGSADGTTRIWDLVSSLLQAGGSSGEVNKNVISTHVLTEREHRKRMMLKQSKRSAST